MLTAAGIANRASGAGSRLNLESLPLAHRFEAERIDWETCLRADLVVLFGGDGTLQHTVTNLLNCLPDGTDASTLPPFAIVPFGTTNMSARNINTAWSRSAAVRRLTHLIEHENPPTLQTRRRPLLEISTETETLYGCFLGLGAIASAVQDWRANRGDTAATNQLRSFVALLRGLSGGSASAPVTVNGRALDVYALLLTTLEQLLYGCTPFWGSARFAGPAELRCTWIEAGTRHLLRTAPAILRGAPRLEATPGFGSEALTHAHVQSDGPFILDGEVYDGNGSFSVRARSPLRWVSL